MRYALLTVLLIIGITVSTSGQSLKSRSLSSDGPLAPGITLAGVQNAAGTYDDINDKCWGNTFVLRGTGEWFSSHLTITMDYISGLPNPEKGNEIIYGTWTMVLFKDNNYFGTVYGDVVKGGIKWSVSPKTGLIDSRNTSAVLQTTGAIDGTFKYWEQLPEPMNFTADTRLDGREAVTVASLDVSF